MAPISKIKGLVKHPNSRVFWFRRVVPEDIRGIDKVGKREIKKSLNTSDLREAEIRAAQLWAEWTRLFQKYRDGEGPIPSQDDLAKLGVWWRDYIPEGDKFEENFGELILGDVLPDGRRDVDFKELNQADLLEKQAKKLRNIDEEIYAGEVEEYFSTATNILKEHGFRTDQETVRRFAPIVMSAFRDAFQIQAARIRGESALHLLQQSPSTYLRQDIQISHLLEEYLSDSNRRLQTVDEWRMIFDRFIQIIEDKPARLIEKSDVRKFKNQISLLPTRTTNAVKALPLNEIIKYAEKHDLRRVSIETVRKHISALRAVLEWGVDNDYLESNPATKMAPKRVPVEQKRRSFSITDLVKIFDPETYYDYPKDDADFWVPYLGLYTGARIEELAQLHHTDIRFEENVPVIEISPDASTQSDDDSKRVKNQSSSRVIPIHKELVDAGFLDFVKQSSNEGQKRLFSDLDRDGIGRLAKETSRHFIRYIRAIGITSPTKVFHSFRHTFKDACRDAGLYEDVHDRLTGHTNSSVGRQYGSGYNLSNLQNQLNKIEYLGVPTISWADYQQYLQDK